MFWNLWKYKCSLPPFEKGGSRGIYLIKSPLTPLFQRGGPNAYLLIGYVFRIKDYYEDKQSNIMYFNLPFNKA
jgi:hypothetical protein